MGSLLIYGAYGYTGRLVVREAIRRGITPVVAGRNEKKVTRQADGLGLDGKAFDLKSPDLRSHVERFDAVLNCAGPFVDTVDPIVEACLETGTDYLDVTGEVPVFERLRQRDGDARTAGITLLPGVGFDVVPTDCLAAFLREQLPSSDRLTLGIKAEGLPSRGTARTLLELAGDGGVVRRNGRLVNVPAAFRSREIDFGHGPEHAVTIPLGDVVTAAWNTDLESVEVYAAMHPLAARALSAADSLAGLLAIPPIETAAKRLIDIAIDGPGERRRSEDRIVVWGEVVDESAADGGRRASARLETPNVYDLTAETAAAAAERVLEGRNRTDRERIPPGFQTPAAAFGPDFVLEFDGVDRELLEGFDEGSEPDRSSGDTEP
ncbi:saccharopine dehydrogenase family protein [Natrarchaeobius chitinivorans]|uniref:Saccharopine dehydrogenase n=1 Tax=Natrarchaeobius chitinivorans TaxID=1679083 RepID=A0A3N6M6P7_NATCH|nr:saccharopine dehydrogenase NADP-binding domain-containing protein [Natrarchaeobius chitinivorans]RQG97877.1 saccharopine dehydrogenase [Natrarchaeobius chitinivorans]